VADRGVLVIVSSPSGAGKTTLTRRLLAEHKDNLEFSVSHTTRAMRPGEVEGRDYHFVTPANRYGTAQAPVEAALSRGKDMIFDVDWQGGAALSTRWPQDSLKIFILPPDLETLSNRLRQRATDAPEIIERRLHNAIGELQHYGEYPHLIVNDELERAYAVLRALYLTRRFGVVDRPDVPYPLSALARTVDANTGAEAHARKLVTRS